MGMGSLKAMKDKAAEQDDVPAEVADDDAEAAQAPAEGRARPTGGKSGLKGMKAASGRDGDDGPADFFNFDVEAVGRPAASETGEAAAPVEPSAEEARAEPLAEDIPDAEDGDAFEAPWLADESEPDTAFIQEFLGDEAEEAESVPTSVADAQSSDRPAGGLAAMKSSGEDHEAEIKAEAEAETADHPANYYEDPQLKQIAAELGAIADDFARGAAARYMKGMRESRDHEDDMSAVPEEILHSPAARNASRAAAASSGYHAEAERVSPSAPDRADAGAKAREKMQSKQRDPAEERASGKLPARRVERALRGAKVHSVGKRKSFADRKSRVSGAGRGLAAASKSFAPYAAVAGIALAVGLGVNIKNNFDGPSAGSDLGRSVAAVGTEVSQKAQSAGVPVPPERPGTLDHVGPSDELRDVVEDRLAQAIGDKGAEALLEAHSAKLGECSLANTSCVVKTQIDDGETVLVSRPGTGFHSFKHDGYLVAAEQSGQVLVTNAPSAEADPPKWR